MITRELKLRPSMVQRKVLESWIPTLTSIYNWAIRKIELNAQNQIYFSEFHFCNLLANHGTKVNIPSHVIQGTLKQAYVAWQRCFRKISKKPKLKSIRNKFNSIPFPDPIKSNNIRSNAISLPIIGWIKFYKQDIPKGSIKRTRIIRRASGWYIQLIIDTVHKFPIKQTNSKVGIDTGLKYLVVLSDGTKFDNPRNYKKGQNRLVQAQRGGRKKLSARLHERIRNRRKDYNHKLSRKIIENYQEVYITNDNLMGLNKKFNKSISDAGISQLKQFIFYKGDIHDRKCVLVDSKYTTMTCSNCGAKSGPAGLSGLAVRNWECNACGANHDRDVNAAMVILKTGLGQSLENAGIRALRAKISGSELLACCQ